MNEKTKIWLYVCRNIDMLNVDSVLPQLSAQRREQVLNYKPLKSKQQSAAAYLLLKKALNERMGISQSPVFSYEEGGKPWLTDYPGIFFNLSHCLGAAVCALSSVPVGVDIEAVREVKQSLITYCMNEDECAIINSHDKPNRFFLKLWTQKEAILKLTGEGIRSALKTVIVTHPSVYVSSQLFDAPEHVMSLAVHFSDVEIETVLVDKIL